MTRFVSPTETDEMTKKNERFFSSFSMYRIENLYKVYCFKNQGKAGMCVLCVWKIFIPLQRRKKRSFFFVVLSIP